MSGNHERELNPGTPVERPSMIGPESGREERAALLIGALSLRMEVRAGTYRPRKLRDVRNVGPVPEAQLFELAASCDDTRDSLGDARRVADNNLHVTQVENF